MKNKRKNTAYEVQKYLVAKKTKTPFKHNKIMKR